MLLFCSSILWCPGRKSHCWFFVFVWGPQCGSSILCCHGYCEHHHSDLNHISSEANENPLYLLTTFTLDLFLLPSSLFPPIYPLYSSLLVFCPSSPRICLSFPLSVTSLSHVLDDFYYCGVAVRHSYTCARPWLLSFGCYFIKGISAETAVNSHVDSLGKLCFYCFSLFESIFNFNK